MAGYFEVNKRKARGEKATRYAGESCWQFKGALEAQIIE
jgi:hypothetical protein